MAGMGMAEIVEAARSELASLTGLELGSTLSANREGEGWRVSIDVVEKHSLPDGMDILATYDVTLDDEANVAGFKRIGLRKRIDTEVALVEG